MLMTDEWKWGGRGGGRREEEEEEEDVMTNEMKTSQQSQGQKKKGSVVWSGVSSTSAGEARVRSRAYLLKKEWGFP